MVLTRQRVYPTQIHDISCWKLYPEWCQLTQGYEPALPPCTHSRNSSTAGHTCRDTSSDVCPSYAAPFLSTCEPLQPTACKQWAAKKTIHWHESNGLGIVWSKQNTKTEPGKTVISKHNREKKESGKTIIPYCHSYWAMIPVYQQNSFEQ